MESPGIFFVDQDVFGSAGFCHKVAGMPEGEYEVLVRIVDRDGNDETLSQTFVVAPVLDDDSGDIVTGPETEEAQQ